MTPLLRSLLAFAALFFAPSIFAQDAPELEPGVYAQFDTTEGKIVARLHYKRTPMTVINFISLAEGTGLATTRKGPFYDGLTFHRCIADFMLQGGCPEGRGTGGPGYKFADEIHPELKHTSPGILSMANSGPATNGSQFFVTHKATPWLDGKHTVFGQVVSGQDIANKIQTTFDANKGNAEKTPKMNKVTILRVGADAEAFKADGAAFRGSQIEHALKPEGAPEGEMAKILAAIEAGTLHQITRKAGTGEPPAKGAKVSAHYTGKLISGKVFDTSKGMLPFQFNVGTGKVIKGWDQAFATMTKGEKRTIIIPPSLGYGKFGAGNIIPPDATLIFDIELVEFE